ncbi:MAG: TraR/DksA family transcriptional regulator [Bdellovibrionales bacterium]
MSNISAAILGQCKAKLLETKTRLMNQLLDQRQHLASREVTGDEADLGALAFDESQLYVKNQRVREQLLEVEFALARIERGNYGVCEETQEPIEAERLLALPWTRLSIEGAEIRETSGRRQTS